MNFDLTEEARGLVALLGWSNNNFKAAIPNEPAEVLLETLLILQEQPDIDEPEFVQVVANSGIKMINEELQRRKERKELERK